MSDSTYFRNKLGDKLQRIPSDNAPPPVQRDDSQMIAAAEQLGFVNRDPEPDIETRQTLGPVIMMTMRVPVLIARKFKQFCKANRFSYWEGIEELMRKAGI